LEEISNVCLRAVLWDMDGVLVDSTELHYMSWNKALADFGIPLTRKKFLKFFGRAPAEVTEGVIGSGVSPTVQAEIRQRKDMFFNDLAPRLVRRIPGALDWVRKFSAHYLQAVASSATLHQVTLMLDSVGLSGYFQTMVTSSDVPGKPDPTVFLTAAMKLHIEPTTCLVIEDSPSGVEASRRAGMRVIAVCTTNPAEALSGADLILPNLTKLTATHLQTLFPDYPDE
jgi:HAD superfamily hydrolase (TIGR01509 family)